jgi:hypothetical protein
MVKAWAEDFVNEYETGFAHKIDWDAAKQVYGTTWFEEKRDEWTYRWGVRYFPADVHGGETYEVLFRKKNFSDLMNVKMFNMSAYKGCAKFNKRTDLKRGDWIYKGFNTKVY